MNITLVWQTWIIGFLLLLSHNKKKYIYIFSKHFHNKFYMASCYEIVIGGIKK